jgi:hypothetical protein
VGSTLAVLSYCKFWLGLQPGHPPFIGWLFHWLSSTAVLCGLASLLGYLLVDECQYMTRAQLQTQNSLNYGTIQSAQPRVKQRNGVADIDNWLDGVPSPGGTYNFESSNPAISALTFPI